MKEDTIKEFRARCQWCRLVTVSHPSSLEGIFLSDLDRMILLDVGFPETSTDGFDYSHLPEGLPWLESIPNHALPINTPKNRYRVLGNGIDYYPSVCIDVIDGTVWRLLSNEERDDYELQFVNSNVYSYWNCWCTFFEKSFDTVGGIEDLDNFEPIVSEAFIQGLKAAFIDIDPPSMQDESTYWFDQVNAFYSALPPYA